MTESIAELEANIGQHTVTNVRFSRRWGVELLSATGSQEDIQRPRVDIFTTIEPLSRPERLSLVIQLALCLQRLHNENVVHGSPSPGCIDLHNVPTKESQSNVTITLKNAGLYFALSTAPHFVKLSEPTRYMAPEYYHTDTFNPTKAGDIYGFASVSYAILSCSPLFPNWRHAQCVATGTRAIAQLVRPTDIPDHVWELLRECWSAAPADRPSISEVVTRLSSR